MEFGFNPNLLYAFAAAFIPVIVNFAMLIFHPDKAQKMGKALIFQICGLVILPFAAGLAMKLGGFTPLAGARILLAGEVVFAAVLGFFSAREYIRKERSAGTVWLIGAFSLILWGSMLYFLMVSGPAGS